MFATSQQHTFWQHACTKLGISADTPCQVWHFGSTTEMAHHLVELVITGHKRATCCTVAGCEHQATQAPIEGTYSLVTERDGTPRCVIVTTEVRQRRFCDVDFTFAQQEGEGDETLDEWRDGHRRYFMQEAAEFGYTFSEDSLLYCEQFKMVYTG
ncbi:ASCH domain-containing protein [Chitinivorax sp. B]|uniref:ASCH domain-containing protein n=1 Tax=Chitinivorax sp. B TaxID=2502235 RepID=UPI0010F5C170|nr:ASCH domain-containing protein [Chitinivorax sp. B]